MSVNGLDKAGSTPLHWASHGGHADCVQRILAVPNCEINVQVVIFEFLIQLFTDHYFSDPGRAVVQ